jgi:two-component system, cell cycle sensor histidine kinase and response regulator CckA
MPFDNESVLRGILENSLAGYWDWNIVSGDEYMSPAFKKMFGYEDHELPNRVEAWQKLIFEEDLPSILEKFNAHVKSHGEVPFHNEVRYRHKDGSAIWVICSGTVIEWDDIGNPLRMAGCHINITDRKLLEESYKNSMEYYEQLLANSFDGMVILDKNGVQRYVSKSVKNLLGFEPEELTNIPVIEQMLHPDDRQAVESAFMQVLHGSSGQVHYRHRHKNGGWVWLEARANNQLHNLIVNGVLVTTRDITDRKKAEEDLKQASIEHETLNRQVNQMQKLDSLGILAGGIAHDFNNLLGGIFGYIDLAADSTKEKSTETYLAKALATMERARGLTGQLLTFSKGGAPVKRIETISQFVEDTVRFALSGTNVCPSFIIAPDLWPCEIDKNQIGQVIDNIVINAAQAMSDGGRIEISAQNVTFAGRQQLLLESGAYVSVSIRDWGIGIPQEVLDKIFDPFFTTKEKGHGLGLATSYSIIKRHGGTIDVTSQPGKGSTFTFYLPAIPGCNNADNVIKVSDHHGTGTFLVMDDEPVILESAGDMLQCMGYSVKTVSDGNEAISFFISELRAGRTIAGALFDLTIPGSMGGRDAVARIREFDKKTPIYVISGYADDPVMSDPQKYGFNGSICKPFRKMMLAELLSKNV